MTFTPYSRIAMNRSTAITYARMNDSLALSLVVFPLAIFVWSSVILMPCAQSTTAGFTPLVSSLTFTATLLSARSSPSTV